LGGLESDESAELEQLAELKARVICYPFKDESKRSKCVEFLTKMMTYGEAARDASEEMKKSFSNEEIGLILKRLKFHITKFG
jgi:hypothetical protein